MDVSIVRRILVDSGISGTSFLILINLTHSIMLRDVPLSLLTDLDSRNQAVKMMVKLEAEVSVLGPTVVALSET